MEIDGLRRRKPHLYRIIIGPDKNLLNTLDFVTKSLSRARYHVCERKTKAEVSLKKPSYWEREPERKGEALIARETQEEGREGRKRERERENNLYRE